MSWELAQLPEVDLSFVGNLQPLEVLYDFEGPCIFTARTPSHALVLAYLSEEREDERLRRFIVATTSHETIASLRAGVISVREAIERGSLWIVDVDTTHKPVKAYAVETEALPDDALPDPTVMLLADLEPDLIVELDGPSILPGKVPADALTQAGTIGKNSLKPLIEWATFREDPAGRPPNWLRSHYTLTTQSVTFGSLKVLFRAGDPAEQQGSLFGDALSVEHERVQEKAWSALKEGLEWAEGKSDANPTDDPERWLAILESMRRMTPGPTSSIRSIRLAGRRLETFRRGGFVLEQDGFDRIRKAHMEIHEKRGIELLILRGRIRELDLDKRSMILRDLEGPHRDLGDVQLELSSDELLESAKEAHFREKVVAVAARHERKRWTATDIQLAPHPPRAVTHE